VRTGSSIARTILAFPTGRPAVTGNREAIRDKCCQTSFYAALQAKRKLEIWRWPLTVTQRRILLTGKATGSRFSQFCNYFRFAAFESEMAAKATFAFDFDHICRRRFLYKKAFQNVSLWYGDHMGQNTAKNERTGPLAAKSEVEIWRRPDFWLGDPNFLFDLQYIGVSISQRYGVLQELEAKVGQNTQLFPVWPRRLVSRIFRITVNSTIFRTILGVFESTSGFWILLPVHRFRFVALGSYRKHI